MDEKGKRPFRIWLDKLDQKIQSRIIARISRFRYGNFGDHKKVTKNIFEARFFFGAGFRVYFAHMEGKIILLLCGGDKSKQKKDIQMAQKYLNNYLEE